MAQRVSLYDFPRLTRFYGIPPKDLARMPYALLGVYAEAMIELMAEETLEAMVVADMPYMKDSDRNKVRKAYARWLNDTPAPEPTQKEAVTPDAPPVIADAKTRVEHAAAVAQRFGITVDTGIES